MNSNSRKITIRKRDGEIHCEEFTVRSNLIIDGAIKTRDADMLTIPNSVETTGAVTVGGMLEGDMGSNGNIITYTGLLGAGPELAQIANQFARVNIYCIDATTGLRAGLPLESTIASAQVLKLNN